MKTNFKIFTWQFALIILLIILTNVAYSQTTTKVRVFNNSVTQTLTANTWTKIIFPTKEFDVLNEFNTDNSRFTAQTEGYYQVNGSIYYPKGGTAFNGFLIIYVNGVNHSSSVDISSYPNPRVSDLVYLHVGDYIELWGYCSVSATVTQNSFWTYLSIFNTSGTLDVSPFDSLTVTDYVKTGSILLNRIMPQLGDSIIKIGASSLDINTNNNSISWTPVPNYLPCPSNEIGGITIANGVSVAEASNSMALGNNVKVGCDAINSFAVGSGVTNNNPNSFLLGFGSNTLYADATNVGIQTIAPTRTLDINGMLRVRDLTPGPQNVLLTAESDGTIRSLPLTNNPAHVLLGDGTFGTPPASLNTWVLGGNNNLTIYNNILGTWQNLDLRIFTDGFQRMVIDKDNGLVGIGTSTPAHKLDVNGAINISHTHWGYCINGMEVLQMHGSSPTPAISNIFVGVTSGMMNTTGYDNAFFGFEAAKNTTQGYGNTALGSGALRYNTIEAYNTAIGYKALYSYGIYLNNPQNIDEYSNNTAVGAQTLFMNETGYENTAVGMNALYSNKGGHANIAIGSRAMYNSFECKGNTVVGIEALKNSTDGLYNTAIGYMALYNTNSFDGSNNVAIGKEAGWSNNTGNNNTFVGNNANPLLGDLHNATAIGANARVDISDCMVLGSIENINGAQTTVKVGIGTTSPQNRLEITDGTPGNSGLRLTNLTAATTPMPINPGQGVLAVNGDGDVVYVEIETYLQKIELLEARLMILEETLAFMQTKTTSHEYTNN